MVNFDVHVKWEFVRDGKVIHVIEKQSESLLLNFMNVVMIGLFGANSTDVPTAVIKDINGVIVTPGTNAGDMSNVANGRAILRLGTGTAGVEETDFKLQTESFNLQADIPTTEIIAGNTVTRVYTSTFTNSTTTNITPTEAGMSFSVIIQSVTRTILIIRDRIANSQVMQPNDQLVATYSITIAA